MRETSPPSRSDAETVRHRASLRTPVAARSLSRQSDQHRPSDPFLDRTPRDENRSAREPRSNRNSAKPQSTPPPLITIPNVVAITILDVGQTDSQDVSQIGHCWGGLSRERFEPERDPRQYSRSCSMGGRFRSRCAAGGG